MTYWCSFYLLYAFLDFTTLVELTFIAVAVYVYFGGDIQPTEHCVKATSAMGLKPLDALSQDEYTFGSYICEVFSFLDVYTYIALPPIVAGQRETETEKQPILEAGPDSLDNKSYGYGATKKAEVNCEVE